MAKVIFELASGLDGEIELRDCVFVDVWKEVFLRNKSMVGIRQPAQRHSYKRGFDYAEHERHLPKSLVYGDEAGNVAAVEKGIRGVEEIMPWTRERPYKGMDWSVTNDIHRGFTTLFITQCTDRVDLTHAEKNELMVKQYNFNYGYGWRLLMQYEKAGRRRGQFEMNESEVRHHLDGTLHKINAGVHTIEEFRVSRRRVAIENMVLPGKMCTLPALDWHSKEKDEITDATRVDYNLGDVARDATVNDPYWNVYDLKNILGKDYMTAYYNYDDPGEWDVCNHFKTTKGGFEILPHMHTVVNHILVPWIHEWGYQAWPEIVSPIQIGHMDEAEMEALFTPSEANGYDLSSSELVKVDLV